MSKIFISYRRDDSSGYAGRLYDRLSQHFGINQVFMDVDHIEPGEDFAEIINQAVGSCSILLALIGRSWITAADKNGVRRLDDPEDFVGLEITSAIISNVRVMPVLVDGASMPLAHQLPEALTLLARRQAAELSNTRFHQDVDRLIENIERALVVKSAAPLASSQPLSPTQETRPPTQDDKQTEPVQLPDVEQPVQQARTLLELPRKRNVQKLLTTAGSLFLLFAAGLWYWDANYRPHYQYYANAITRSGLPEGVGPVSIEQMRHRNASLEFIRKGRQGDVQEVRVINSRGKYPPVFASSGSNLSRLLPVAPETSIGRFSMPTGLVARRVVFERSHDGRILAQRVYNASDRVLYTLQYLEPNLAKFGDGPFAEAIRESGISHVKFVRADTEPETGLIKEMFFLDSSGNPKPDRDGTYGTRYTLDSRRRVVEEINLDQKGDPVPDKVGTVRVNMTYDDTWGNMIRLKNLDADGQSISDSAGAAELTMSYDRYGNLQQIVFLDKDGRPVTQRALGAAIRTFAYDDGGNIVENTFKDPNHKLVKGALGFAKQTVSWNEQGDSTETFFGPDDQPQLIKGRVVKLKGKWDERGNLLAIEHFNERNDAIRANDGCAKITLGYDKHGNITEEACFDEGGRAVRNIDGWAKAKMISDDRGNTIERRYFGPANQLELYEERFVKTKLKYNEQNKQTEEAYFDTKDRPVKNKTGYAKTTYSYDTRGKLVQVSFFDEKGQPTARKGGYAQIVRVYDGRGYLGEETLLDAQGKPKNDNEGYARARFKYDDRGYRTETAHFDENDRLTLHAEGYARLRQKYNHSGQVIERALFGLDDALILHKKFGYSRTRWTYDNRGNVSQNAYLGTNDQLVRNTLGYALVRYTYDKLGRERKREFFDVDSAPVRTRVAVHTVEPDSNGHRFLMPGDLLMDYDGNEIVDTRVFYELELERGESRRELRVQRAGKLLTVEVPPGRLKGIETMDKVSPEARRTGA